MDSILVDELVESLQSYELDLPKTGKSKSMALKFVDDVDASGFDDDLSATEIAYLAKNFKNFLKNNNKRAKGKNTVEPRNFRRNDPTKVKSIEKPKEKVGQLSNNSMGPQCFGCQGYGHMKSECLTYLRSKSKAMAITLSDDEVSDDESFDEFYAKLNDIVNSAYNLGEIYDQPKIFRKILRSLTEDFRPR